MLERRARDLRRRQPRAEIRHAPAEMGRCDPDHEGTEFVCLSCRRADNEVRHPRSRREFLIQSTEKDSCRCREKMLVRGGHRAVAPKGADFFGQRRDHSLEKPLLSEYDKPALQRLFECARVEQFDSVEAFGADRRTNTADPNALRQPRLGDEVLELFRT